MSSVTRASAAGLPSPAVRGLSVAALALAVALTAGCSNDFTRFDLMDGGQQHPPDKLSYVPRGYGGSGKGVKESSLPPTVKTADSGSKSYGSSPWSWANGPEPKWSGKPLWTDQQPFPWPDGQPRDKAPELKPSFQGHYTTRRSDTLAGIAGHYKVSLAELRRVNGIPADQTHVKAGTVLAIPARGSDTAPPPTAPPRVVQTKPVTAPPAPKIASLDEAAPLAPAPKMAVKHSSTASEDKAPPETTGSTAGGKFRWPVVGKVIATFGPQPDGSKNEGIKLSVPLGTDVHAAEAGRVHYAGDGLKGYGNLILIRHANGWVTTYAHADKMLVKVGDEVKRGQVIAKAGRTGPVSQPQLGFELRKGSVPVNPLDYLAK